MVGMDHTLPMQVRTAVVNLRDQGHTYEEIAALLGIGRASVSRLLRRRRERGALDRFPRSGGWESPIRGRIADLLCRIVEKMNDATTDELTQTLISELESRPAAPVSCARWRGWALLEKKSRWFRRSASQQSTAIAERSSARSSPR
jgi:predicted transcriptional regulator